MKRSIRLHDVLSCVIAGAMLAGCSGHGTVPPTQNQLQDLTMATSGGAFSGSYSGTYTVSGQCPQSAVTYTYNGNGTSSFLGASHETGTIAFSVGSTPEGIRCIWPGAGSFVLASSTTPTNKIYLTLQVSASGGSPGVGTMVQNFAVTGGSGAFANATGSGTMTITTNANSTYSDKWTGTLSYNPPGHPSIVQKASGGTHSTSTSCTFANSPAAGNVIVFGVGYYPLTTAITAPSGVTAINASNPAEHDYYRVVRTGDGKTWTFTGSGFPYINVICYEVTGENASTPVDAHGENHTSTQGQTTASVTPVTSGDLPIAFFGNGNRTGFTGLTSGWSDDVNETRGYYYQFGTHGPLASLSPVHASITLSGGAAAGGTALVLIKP